VLIPDNVYGPVRQFCRDWLMPRGIAHTIYDAMIGAAIGDVMTERTKLVWIESPGSVTFEVQDAGASGVFSLVLRRGADARLGRRSKALRLFAIGASWGGTRSLIAPMSVTEKRTTAAP
jgi:cystathionine beta-lyase/cystathionine gamma-synthase